MLRIVILMHRRCVSSRRSIPSITVQNRQIMQLLPELGKFSRILGGCGQTHLCFSSVLRFLRNNLFMLCSMFPGRLIDKFVYFLSLMLVRLETNKRRLTAIIRLFMSVIAQQLFEN